MGFQHLVLSCPLVSVSGFGSGFGHQKDRGFFTLGFGFLVHWIHHYSQWRFDWVQGCLKWLPFYVAFCLLLRLILGHTRLYWCPATFQMVAIWILIHQIHIFFSINDILAGFHSMQTFHISCPKLKKSSIHAMAFEGADDPL